MKKTVIWILLLSVLLAGCGGEQPAPETEMPAPEQTQLPTFSPAAEEDILYFSNEPEYSRLYSVNADGSDLKLVLDRYCYSVQRQGEWVYFLDETDLCAYHIPTESFSVLEADVIDYAVDGTDLAYLQENPEAYHSSICYRDMETGEKTVIDTCAFNDMDLCDGRLYYSKYNFDAGESTLCEFDVQSKQLRIIVDDYANCHSLLAVPDGVYHNGFYLTDTYDYDDRWYFAPAGEGAVQVWEEIPGENVDLLEISDRGILYTQWSYIAEETSQVYLRTPQGEDRLLFESEPSAYVSLANVGDGRWLIRHQVDEPVGQINEYGYHDHYAYRITYYLLDQDGTVTKLDTKGKLGNLFAAGDFPVIDSSTARKPVTWALYSLFVLDNGNEGVEPVCSTTHGAWLNIADRVVDLALLAAPTQEEKDYLQQRGVSVDMKLYGGDGLVFIGNAANPVTDLTHEQILAIYRGEITNWSQVGGPDREITVYYRDEQSGSQRLFEKLVFKGQQIPDFENMGFAYMDDMSTIVDIVLEDPYAIGYSIMTYLDEVYAEEQLQVFAVNGVKPSPDTVKDATYPYHTQGYVVIRSDEPADSPARRLFNWFGSSACDDLLEFNSVTPLTDGVG